MGKFSSFVHEIMNIIGLKQKNDIKHRLEN